MYFYKNPSETKTFEVSFADSILTSEQIVDAGMTLSITNIDLNGISTSSLYVTSSLAHSGSVISFKLRDGDDDSVYKLRISTSVTHSGNVYSKTCYLYVTSEEESLVSLADMKSFLGISNTANDGVLLSILRSATDFVCSYTNKTFRYDRYIDTYYLEESCERLKLDNYPATNIESIVIDGITLEQTTAGYANYVIESDGFVRRLDGLKFPYGNYPIVVTYTAGYKAVPEDVLYVVKKITASDFNTRLQEGILSEALGTYKITYANNKDSRALNGQIKDILDKYATRLI